MQRNKHIWLGIFLASGLEAATFIGWMTEIDPVLLTGLLTLTLAADSYVLPKAGFFFYQNFKERENFADFCETVKPF